VLDVTFATEYNLAYKQTVGRFMIGGKRMARVVKEEEYATKRNEIVSVAQRLVYTKGYEQISIQDILNELQISKGAFYHYFDSKQALLEALIDRIQEEAEPLIVPIVTNPELPALEKLHRFFDTTARWKTARKEYLLSLMKVWYADENILIRTKTHVRIIKHFSVMLADIIRQGVAEGVMTTSFPDQVADMAFAILLNVGDTFMELLLDDSGDPTRLQRATVLTSAYNESLERMLGAATGSLHLMDMAILKDWFEPSSVAVAGNNHD
jgi:AcrR family transcriptional regulator